MVVCMYRFNSHGCQVQNVNTIYCGGWCLSLLPSSIYLCVVTPIMFIITLQYIQFSSLFPVDMLSDGVLIYQ